MVLEVGARLGLVPVMSSGEQSGLGYQRRAPLVLGSSIGAPVGCCAIIFVQEVEVWGVCSALGEGTGSRIKAKAVLVDEIHSECDFISQGPYDLELVGHDLFNNANLVMVSAAFLGDSFVNPLAGQFVWGKFPDFCWFVKGFFTEK